MPPQMAAPSLRVSAPRLGSPALAFLPVLGLASFALLPQVSANPRLAASFWGAAAGLLSFLLLLSRKVSITHRTLVYEFSPRPVHYVQLVMHSSVYAYWGWFWPEVYRHVPLILAQIVFVYALDMLVCWWRRDTWILGFGPFPIVLSTNLFLWFRDDWFFLQFLMLAVGVLAKEFIRWKRDGNSTHIFNPSAFALFVFSLGLILTRTSSLTWGEDISTTFHRPPNIYFEIFVLGLVVQALFSVTLVTLSAAASLYVLNLAFTSITGVYFFVDTNIPPAVFLGLHLLVTDPATSPRKTFGKILFGGAYGAGVFGLYGLLGAVGAPQFYDKLLCVPILNLTVRALDRASTSLSAWFARQQFHSPRWSSGSTPRQANFAWMGVWIALFGVMTQTHFVGGRQPGSTPAFWVTACEEGRWHACRTLAHSLDVACQNNSGPGCFSLGMLLNTGKEVARNSVGAAKSFGRGCELGVAYSCFNLADLVRTEGPGLLESPCNSGDSQSCVTLGLLYLRGQGVEVNQGSALALFRKACHVGSARGCGLVGESYLFGEGTRPDISQAKEVLERACILGDPASCFNTGLIYRKRSGTASDELLARNRLQRACDLGFRPGCRALVDHVDGTPASMSTRKLP